MPQEYTVKVHFIDGTEKIVPAKDIQYVGGEGARRATALVDGKEVPIYKRSEPEWGPLWYEQERQPKPSPEEGPDASVWATSTDLKGDLHERKVYFVLIRDGNREINVAITHKPALSEVHADMYVTPDYSYTIHDSCDHQNDECVLDNPNFEEDWYGVQPETIYQEVRKEYLPAQGE